METKESHNEHNYNEYKIRKFYIDDYHKGIGELMNQLSPSKIENIDQIKEYYCFINSSKNQYHYVIEHDDIIVCTASLLIEKKIIHGFKSVGHIEDLVVHKNYRKRGLAKKMINKLIDISKKNNCYKVILNCDKKCISFYEKFNFVNKNVEMSLYF